MLLAASRHRLALRPLRAHGLAATAAIVAVAAVAMSPLSGAIAISIENPQDALIAPTGVRRSIGIRISMSADDKAQPLRFHSRLRLYDQTGLAFDPASPHDHSHSRMLSPPASPDPLRFPLEMTLPEPGLYQLELTVSAPDGSALATAKVRLASVLPRKANTAPPDDWGVCTHFAHNKGVLPRSLELIRLAGFSRIRDEVYWDNVEKKPGEFVFPESADACFRTARALGLRPLIILSYGNRKTYPSEFAGSKGFPESPEARALFVRYARETVSRYRPFVKDWELWNEPHAWGQVSPPTYTTLLREVYPEIHAIDPEATVISCGGGGAGGGPGGQYITGIRDSGGLAWQDAFSIHPYMAPGNNPDTGYPAKNSPIPRVSIPVVWPHLQNFIDKNRRPDGKPLGLWVTELGWFSSPLGFANPELTQAAWFARAYLLSRRHGVAKAVFWYDFQDDGNDPGNKEHNFGLITTGYQPKPAYVTAATLSATLGNRTWHRALVENDVVRIFEYKAAPGEPGSVIVGWTVADEPRTAAVQLPVGRYIRRDWRGQETPAIIPGGRDQEWKLGPMPEYLIRQP
jgi:hypothetical protein